MAFPDSLIAIKLIKKLTTPWEETDAYKTGVIDENGKILIDKKNRTKEQKKSYSLLDRLTFKLKRLMGRVGLGSKIGSYVGAMFLLREQIERIGGNANEFERLFMNHLKAHGKITDRTLFEESCYVYDQQTGPLTPGLYRVNGFIHMIYEDECYPVGEVFGYDVFRSGHNVFTRNQAYLLEEAPANNVGSGNIAGMDGSVAKRIKPRDKFGNCHIFDVDLQTYTKCTNGRKKYDRWAKYMDMEDVLGKSIKEYAHRNPRKNIILRNPTGTMIYLKRG